MKYRTTPLTRDEWVKSYASDTFVYDTTKPASSKMCYECKAHSESRDKKWPPCGIDDRGRAELNRALQWEAIDTSGVLAGLDDEDKLELNLEADPVLWAMTEFEFDGQPWYPRWYQEIFMRCTATNRAALWGRRSGKSECMIALCLWHARYRIGEQGADRNYHIQVFVNSEALANKHWDEFMNFINHGRTLHAMKATQQKGKLIQLSNNTTIHINVLSMKQLGQDAHLMWFDEAAFYESDEAFTHASAIRLSRPNTPLIMTSNSSGFRGKFYEFCHQRDTYLLQLPSYVNPDWNQEMEMFARKNYNTQEYETLILADWGQSETGVFSPQNIETCLNNVVYSTEDVSIAKPPGAFRVLGNDWNEGVNGVHFVIVEFDPDFRPTGRPVFRVLHKKVISGHEYNHEVAQQQAYSLLMRWGCDAAFLDDGGGGNIAVGRLKLLLRKQGHSNLANQVHGIQMASNYKIPDYGGEMMTKRAKNLIVNTCQILLEQYQLAWPVEENEEVTVADKRNNIIPQMRAFRVDKWDVSGRAIYGTDLEDHTLTAWMLAVYGCAVNCTNMIVEHLPGQVELLDREQMPSEKPDKKLDKKIADEATPGSTYIPPSAPRRLGGLPGWNLGPGSRSNGLGKPRKRTW